MITVITPHIQGRSSNLRPIHTSLFACDRGIEWIVVSDYDIQDNIRNLKLVNIKKDGLEGGRRNMAVDVATNDYVFCLDDDTIIHPNLIKETQDLMDGENIIMFNQLRDNGKTPDFNSKFGHILKGTVDTGMFLIPTKYMKDIRWSESISVRCDWDFINRLYQKYGEKFVYVNKILSFYNFLKH